MYKVLTIAGSDCSGGAGIQADIKTITAHGMYAMSAITALTAQNTTGVYGVLESTPEFLRNQLSCIFTDIFPDAVKIGMVSGSALIDTIADSLIKFKAVNIVLDTVMVATSGSPLLKEEAKAALIERLIPIADVITPNIPEAQVLLGREIKNTEDMRAAALDLYDKFGCACLVKGGHGMEKVTDILCDKGKIYIFEGTKIDTNNSHGTGCTLSSAIACNLAEGRSLSDSIRNAKDYLTGALANGLNLGKGSGPVNHCYMINKQ